MAEPTTENIGMFTAVTQADSSVAIRFLKKYHTAESAINAFFDPDAQQAMQEPQWSESAFTGSRMPYAPTEKVSSAFQIHSEDTLSPYTFDATANLSRPPSRASEAASMTVLHDEEESAPRLEGNVAESRVSTGQESGVTEMAVSRFGPAADKQYNAQQWALTIPTKSQEIIPNPAPELRSRQPQAPAFLKPLPSGSYLSALITILHNIPAAREAFLVPRIQLDDYGRDSEWWTGEAISGSRIDAGQGRSLQLSQDFMAELQRLMAFLAMTDRAYGSIGVISDLLAAVDASGDSKSERSFFDAWHKNMIQLDHSYNTQGLFTITHYSTTNQSADAEPDTNMMDVVDLRAESNSDLYAAMDQALWGAQSAEDSEISYLTFGDILILALQVDKKTPNDVDIARNFGVPSVFYVDRYSQEAMIPMEQIRREITQISHEVTALSQQQTDLVTVKTSSTSPLSINASELLEVVQNHLQARQHVDHSADATSQDNTTQPKSTAGSVIDIASELQVIADRVTQKYRALEQAKTDAVRKMEELSKIFTRPSEDGTANPSKGYLLRGLTTEPSKVYVRHRPDNSDDLIDIDNDVWPWWRVSFEVGEENPVKTERIEEAAVLEEARSGFQKMLLIYAKPEALQHGGLGLSEPLRKFVASDNFDFAAELGNLPARQTTPIKRKVEVDEDEGGEPNWGGWRSHDVAPAARPNLPDQPTANAAVAPHAFSTSSRAVKSSSRAPSPSRPSDANYLKRPFSPRAAEDTP